MTSDAAAVMSVQVAGPKLALRTPLNFVLLLQGARYLEPSTAQRLARRVLFFFE
ncbi:MAG: hypothetical protein JNL67_04330 [Planctomycetaceae bacterium]|nr:hypothetical protein [Planctomycetaceae bacterium]